MIVAGEASGDLHGAHLIQQVRELDPEISFYGLGSDKMRQEGAEIIIDSTDFGIIGISEILSGIRQIKAALNLFKERVRKDRPSLLILIDYPEFNLRLAAYARSLGVPVLYYISPQVWAWRKGRIKKIARIVDRMAVVFPFEVDLYKKEGLDTRFVGHPLIDSVQIKKDAETLKKELAIGAGEKVISLLPGSRSKEINMLLPEMLEAAEIMASRSPEFRFVLPLAHTIDLKDIDEKISLYNVEVEVVEGMTYDVLNLSDMAFIASGTASLEAAIIGTPMVVIYKASLLSYMIGKFMVLRNIPHFSLPNIVAGKAVVPELLQDEANAGRMVDEAFAILFGAGISETMKKDLAEVKSRLGGGGASKRTAELVVEMVNE